MKSIHTIILAIMENTVIKAHTSFINLKWMCHLSWPSLHFVLLLALQTYWITIQAKKKLCTYPSFTPSHNERTANHHLRNNGDGNGVQRRTKISFGRAKMQVLELIQLVKSNSITVSQSGGWSVSWSVSQSVEKSLKYHFKNIILTVERFMVDLKTFLDLAMPNIFCLDVTK